jgi:hypothetical protein
VWRQVVELESRYITLSMDKDIKYSNQLPLENSIVLSILMEVEWTTGSSANERGKRILAHAQYDTKIIQLCSLANIGRLNLYSMHTTKCETVAKILGKEVAKLWSNDHV